MKLVSILIVLMMGLNILCSGIVFMQRTAPEMELFLVFVITLSLAIIVLALKGDE